MSIVDRLGKFFPMFTTFDAMPEEVMAHNVRDPELRAQITARYNELFRPEPSPYTHPELYDPLNPPQGWAWDPFYECWLETHDSR
jgi:hypothetical protein